MVNLLFSHFCHLWSRERYLSLTINQSITFDRKIAPKANIWSNIIQCILLPLLLNIHIFCTRCGRQLHPCHPLLYFEEGKPQLLNDILWNIPGSLKHTLKNQKRYQIKCMLIRPRKVREMLGRKGPRVKCAKVWVGNWSLGYMVSCDLVWSDVV